MGYSVGRWDFDTLVVESNGFTDRSWLDFGGHPHTEKAAQVTMVDPELHAKPIVVGADRAAGHRDAGRYFFFASSRRAADSELRML